MGIRSLEVWCAKCDKPADGAVSTWKRGVNRGEVMLMVICHGQRIKKRMKASEYASLVSSGQRLEVFGGQKK